METVHKLADRTSHLALGSPPPPGSEPAIPRSSAVDESVPVLSPLIKSYLAEIYKSLTADPASKADFLHKFQGEKSSSLSSSGDGDGKEVADPLASLAGFQAYMASSASGALRCAEKQDISAPITDYFISSSHNTYLTGNQLYSDASAGPYTNVCIFALFYLPLVVTARNLVGSRADRRACLSMMKCVR